MLRNLRMRFIAITMAIVLVMLCVIFALVLHFTRESLEHESVSMMQAVAADPMQLNWPETSSRLPYFTVRISVFGSIRVIGTSYYDLTDTAFLSGLVSAATESGKVTGLLPAYSLRYYRTGHSGSEYIIFADVSSESSTLRALSRSFVLIGLGSLAVFFLLSLLLARWAVRPVEQAWKQQTEFVSDASHELKTPLTVILTNAELLRSGEHSSEEKDRFAENILTMSERMRELVERLLSLARADNGTMRTSFETVDLSALLTDTLLPFEPVFYERGLSLSSDIEAGIHICGSAGHLRQVAEILLDNARKYAEEGTVEVTLKKQGRSRVLLTVATPGEPLSAEDRKNIFRRFYRKDAARSSDGGYGLGLAIAESLVKEHRGKIWCEARDGGNAFLVQLPTE